LFFFVLDAVPAFWKIEYYLKFMVYECREMKEKIFGTSTFWATEILPTAEFEQGILARGNFRGDKQQKFKEICERVSNLYGDKYIVRMIEERELQMEGDSEPRVSLQIIPTEVATPPPSAGWQRGLAAILIGMTLISSLQLGISANIGLLPRETLLWLSNPDNINSDILPPGLETFDPLPFLDSAIKVGGAALIPQLAHELTQRVAAFSRNIKTGPSYLIPNGQLGSFGSITQLKSLAKNKTDLFDFAASGLVGGGIASVVLFITGLIVSQSGGGADAGLVPVPSQLLQGSLVLGGICKLALGPAAASGANIYVSPLLIGGWCGLVATSLNALPVGTLDGGRTMLVCINPYISFVARMMSKRHFPFTFKKKKTGLKFNVCLHSQAAYGKTALAFTSLATYIGLGLGILGNALALPFGLYVLICQRQSERNIQDEVTEIDEGRKKLALAIATIAVLMLLPGIPDPAQISIDSGTFL